MHATVKDLRLHTKALLAATERGEEVVITYRGEPCARLVRAHGKKAERRSRNPAFGLWADRNDISVADQVRHLRQPRRLSEEELCWSTPTY